MIRGKKGSELSLTTMIVTIIVVVVFIVILVYIVTNYSNAFTGINEVGNSTIDSYLN